MTHFSLDPDSHEGDTANKIVFALERLSHVFRIHWWEENKKYGLSPLQMQILVVLRFQPRRDSISALAGYLDLAPATVSDAVRVLGEKGYVQKRAHPEDGRRVRIVLTVSGANVAEAVSQFANQIGDYVRALPNQGIFLESLLTVMEFLQVNGLIPLQRMCTTCRHFRREGPGATPYYCRLLEKPLRLHELRIDCPEHEPRM